MKTSSYFKLFVIVGLLVATFAGFGSAQALGTDTTATTTTTTANSSSITFPIPDLGNCGSAAECKTYCDLLAHAEACAAFGKAHGLISSNDADNALKLKNVKTGPGGCTSKEACKTFCDDPVNSDTCAKFASDHKLLKTEDLNKFKKFNKAAVEKKTPGACHDQHTCETFCEEKSHNEECLKFAKDNGLIDDKTNANIEKFQTAVAAGETPGGCDSKDACQTFCSDVTNRAVCLKFAQDQGFIKPQDAKTMATHGFTGPGGCDSKDACETFCNDPTNQQTCVDFAKQHKLINPTDAQNIQNATNVIHQGLDGQPPQILDCLRQNLGTTTVDKIESGSFTPDTTSAQSIKTCVLKSADAKTGNMTPPTSFQLPAEIKACILKNYGQELLDQIQASATTAGLKDKIALCLPSTTLPKPTTIPPTSFQLPPVLKDCIVKNYGQTMLDAIANGGTATSELKSKIPICLPNSTETKPPVNTEPPTMMPPANLPPTGFQLPPVLKDCIMKNYGQEVVDGIMNGSIPTSELRTKIPVCLQTTEPKPSSVQEPFSSDQ